MAEESILDKFGSFFSGNNMNDPRVNSQLRQRIALQMMSRDRKGYPKNVGEGLTAIGDALGDIGIARRLEASDLAQQQIAPPAAAPAGGTPLAALAGSTTMAYAPEGGGGGEDYQPAPQQPAEQAPPPQASVFESGAPPVQGLPPGTAGLPPPVQPPAETYQPPTPEQTSAGRNALAAQLLARQRGAAGGQPPNPMLAGAVPASMSTAVPSPSTEPDLGSRPDPRLALNAQQDAPGAVTDIRRAPPARPVQVAQAQQQYPAGYVPPEPGAPPSVPTIPMKPREVQLRNWLAANQGNPYAAMKVAPELQQLEQERTTRQTEVNELFKAQIARGTEQAKLRLQAQIDQAKRLADIEHTKAQARKEGIIKEPEDSYVLGPDGVARPIRVEGEDPNAPPGGKLSENEQKTLIYHGWAKLGNQAITGNDQLLAHGLAQEALGKIPVFGNTAQDAEYRRAKNGADNFILAFMRSTSGAAYGVSERLDHAKAMLPKLGDDPKTLADKAAQRQQFVDTEYAGLGTQARKKADFIAKNYDPGSDASRQRLVDIELQGVKGKEIGEIKTNRKTGAQVMWNGSRWVPHATPGGG
jgi:hypothetical protein